MLIFAPAPLALGQAPIDQPSKRQTVVEGQVTDAIGSGVAGATVTVRFRTDDDGEGRLIATATTDELGDFVVTAAKPIHGDIVVTITKPLLTPIVREFHLVKEDAPPYLAETFAGNLVVIGRVTDALTDKPVVGASVNLEALYRDWYATTDDQGRFTIKGVFPGSGAMVVEATGYGRQRRTVAELADFGEIPIRIKPERIIHFKAVDDLGRPIAGVTIECYDEPRDDFRTVVTDEGGLAMLRGMHFDASTLNVRLSHDEYVSSEGFDQTVEPPKDRTESTHKLVLPRAGRITGTVTAAQTGDPLGGARVMTGTVTSDDSPRDWADDRGKYTIHGVKPSFATVTVHLSGYAPELKTVEVKAEKTTVLDIQLGSPAVLRGAVKDSNGNPVPGVYVAATKWRGSKTLGLRAVTDREGRFVMENAPADEFEIAALPRGGSRVRKPVPAGADRTVALTVSTAPSATGLAALAAIKIGDTAPILTVISLDGNTIKMADLKGKTILLDFWATWCAPCVVEMPHWLKVYDKFGKRRDFVMIGISLDGDENALKDFIRKRKLNWPQVFGETAQKAADRYGVGGIPSSFVVAPDGKIVAMDLRGAEIVKRIEQILNTYDPT